MYLNIIFLPLLSFIWISFFGRFFTIKTIFTIAIGCIFYSWFFSLIIFSEVVLQRCPCYLQFDFWFDSGLLDTKWGFMFDSLTCVMLLVVLTVSLCVHFYSFGYMDGDPHFRRFISYLSLFTFFMIILITGDNFFQLFVGWEGVGICSYLLINFWYNRLQANKAALKAVIVNRIGDVALALAIFLLYSIFKTLDFSVIFCTVPFFFNSYITFLGLFNINIITLICFFLFIAVVGKSAQIFLHTWLADAMEGPTPVSALIHAATMVTAGVFLILRCSPIFQYSSTINVIIIIFGSITALMASTIGAFQNDLKKVIAYSTCSQLGYMVLACGLSGYEVSIFHLSNHAFFKALLFLSAGSIIHALADEQDMRKMGGLKNFVPFTYIMFVIGSLALMGFPFLSGFYSKDIIIELAYGTYTVPSFFAFWLVSIAAFFTAFYSIRLLCLTFLIKPNVSKKQVENIHESYILISPLILLAFLSMFIGYFSKDMMVGLGTDFWNNAFFTLPENIHLIDAEFLPIYIKLIPLIFSFTGAFISYIIYYFMNEFFIYKLKKTKIFYYIYNFFNRKWYFDYIYNFFLVQKSKIFFYSFFYKKIERGFLEYLGPYGVTKFFEHIRRLRFNYAYFLNIDVAVLIFFLVSIFFFFVLCFVFFIFKWSWFFYFFTYEYHFFILIFFCSFFFVDKKT